MLLCGFNGAANTGSVMERYPLVEAMIVRQASVKDRNGKIGSRSIFVRNVYGKGPAQRTDNWIKRDDARRFPQRAQEREAQNIVETITRGDNWQEGQTACLSLTVKIEPHVERPHEICEGLDNLAVTEFLGIMENDFKRNGVSILEAIGKRLHAIAAGYGDAFYSPKCVFYFFVARGPLGCGIAESHQTIGIASQVEHGSGLRLAAFLCAHCNHLIWNYMDRPAPEMM
jgi:hypothetical protein